MLDGKQQQGNEMEIHVLLAELKACSRTKNLERGRKLHAEAIQTGNVYIVTALVNMYAKCACMGIAREVFDSIRHPDAVSWTALILGYAENGEPNIALEVFSRMKSYGCVPDSFTFVAALKACSNLALRQHGWGKAACLERGKTLHAEIGCHSGIYVQSTLIDMYAKCGSMAHARHVFNSMKERNVVSWTALILGYAENEEGTTALDMFAQMKSQGCLPNLYTYVAALKACTSIALKQDGRGKADCLERGKQIHREIGSHLDGYVESTLIDMYAKCGSIRDARNVFDNMKHPNVVSWNAILLGYAENGESATALNLFKWMKSQGCIPDWITLVAALKACGSLVALESGRAIHSEIDTRLEGNWILVTSLVDFYAKCGSLVEAQKIFDEHARTRDLTTWTALLAGYSRLGDEKAVFKLFEGMQDQGFRPDGVTFLCVLACCSHAGLVPEATVYFEAMATKYGIVPTVEHYNCMVDILGRSNKLGIAIALLRSMPCAPDGVSWMTLLGACHKWKNVGLGTLALESLVSLDGKNAIACLIMAQIYASRGMRKEQEMVLRLREQHDDWKEPAQSSWTNVMGESQVFLVS